MSDVKLTVGYKRSDGDIDVIAAFNSNSLDEEQANDLRQFAEQLAEDFAAEIFEREDLPDVLTVEQQKS